MNYIKIIEKILNKKAKINYLPLQTGDIKNTLSDTTIIKNNLNYKPKTQPEVGVKKFIKWFKSHYKINE